MLKKLTKKIVLPIVAISVISLNVNTAHAKLGDEILVNGMTNDDIQTLQEDLRGFGFLTIDNPTKYFGNATEAAVLNFQKSQGIEETGKYDQATHKAFESFKNNKINAMKEKNELLTYTRDLDLKDTGADVLKLQEQLKALGFLVIDNCTDYYGQMTKDAVSLLQETYGLKANGVTGLRTIDLINDILLGRVNKKEVPNRGASRNANGIIGTASKLKGARYSYGSIGPNSFDCSGFTKYVFGQHGIDLPRSSVGQANYGSKVAKGDLQPGDLLIFSNTYRKGPSHVGVYVGNGKFIHASTSRGVVTDSINSGYYSSKFSYGRRVK
ncbi:MAG TPA: NlpC/P60 family protein [Tissierellaceae bacterium]